MITRDVKKTTGPKLKDFRDYLNKEVSNDQISPGVSIDAKILVHPFIFQANKLPR
jgi:hypothetical protein